ncbi:uncharacterized protein LOC127444300 [Myxocyprinus asiaticus]|uniref:uncharacterized protein LOC127444300 n=1 Tax=Myxocyprinus asiaticus TaxID=70543 RepID=UPI002222C345|nr:uncharacterized protein LOC127444300 [Myxocyprinus asiaticus]
MNSVTKTGSSSTNSTGSALVTSKLLFNSTSQVPSEALVLSVISTLLNSRESKLNESVKLVNVSYEKISETSYLVTFTFNLINISMPEDPELSSNTYQRVQDITNNALNTLLNEPESQVFEPKSYNFTTTSNHIEGIVEYTFQDGNVIKPVSFLNELGKLMGLNTTTVSPLTTSSFPVTPLNQVSGSALVTSKLLFNSSSPVPSKALVLNVISTLLNSRESQLNESVKLVNVSYEKISETSYLVIFTFNLINISMPEDPELRSNTYQRVQDIINNALNTLLNKPESQVFEPKSSNFTTTLNHIEGIVEYTFQDGDVIKPVSFLNELGKLMGLNTTTVSPLTTSSFPVTPLNQISGSALVTSKLLFNSSSPVPSKALVLSVISTLLNSRESHFNESVKLMNVSYEKISETSYLVTFTFNLINISMPEDPELRSNTYQRVQDIINNALNTLLNKPESQVFEPKSSNFTTTSNHIEGIVEYTFQDGNVIKPVSFLNELGKLMGLNTTTVSPLTKSSFPVTPLNQVSGSALVTSKLLFNSSSPVPSKALVLSVISTLLNSRESHFNESVKLVNVSYEKISETSYLVTFTFNLINISMPEDPELRSNTYQRVQDIINNALNTLLNKPESQVFEPKSSNFTTTLNHIEGIVEYTFQDGDVIKPVSFLNELGKLMGLNTTTVSPLTKSSFPVTPLNQVSGSALVTSKLLFNSSSPVPSKALVLSVISTLLNSRESHFNESVKLVNVSYEKISETSYLVTFTFNLINISMPEDPELRSNTYQRVQDIINNALNTLLNKPESQVFEPKSSNFTTTSNHIEGIVEYTFQDGNVIKPVSFLNELGKLMGLNTTTVYPLTTSSFPVTPLNQVSGSALVTSKLLFNSSSPVPSKALVLSVISTLLNSRESHFNESVKLVNVSYEKISETSYLVTFTFNLINISMPEDTELRSNTNQRVQDIINNALNTLLNKPESQVFEPKSSNFTTTLNHIEGIVEYTFQDGDVIKPVSFLNELGKLMGLNTTTVYPLTTSSFPVTPLNQVSGSALVTSKLLFNSSSPVPSKALVLSVISTLLNSRESHFNESVKLVNVSYEKISETSYLVTFTFNLINISMPEDPELRSNTYQRVQDIINNALNTLLNKPESQVFEPKSSNFTTTSNHIEGIVEYTFQDGNVIKPVSFLNELGKLMGLNTTTLSPLTKSSFTVTPLNQVSGSALVTSKLLFNSSSPVPSKALVLSVISTLLNSRESHFNESVKLVNVSYEKISETSYLVTFTFNLINISMPEDPELRSNTYQRVQDIINNALNTLLNKPESQVFEPKSSNFTTTSNHIEGIVEYTFQDGNVIKPVSFLNELGKLMGLNTTTVSPLTTSSFPVTPLNQVSGSALVTSKLLFNSSSPVPSKALVLSVISTLLNSRESHFNESVKLVNVSYEKISETSYLVTFTFNLINISMPEDPELRSNTYQRVQDIINNALNTLLNKPESQVFEPKSSNFTTTSNHIEGIVEYTFQDGNVIKPVSFLNELGKLMGLNTTTVSPLTTSSFPVTPLNQVSGSALVTSKLLFNSSSPVPSKALVLSVISTLLNSRESHFNESVKLVNVSYEKISETSYLVTFTFNLINISMPEDPELRSNTYQRVQDIINNALNTLLNKPESQVFEPKSSNFTTTSNHIEGIVEYTFQDGNVIKPVSFLNELGKLMGLNTTTVYPLTTSSFPVTPLNQVSGSALVTSKLLFNSSSPVPSKALVLSVISTLLNSRESHFNESVKLVNVSYEKISETSYLVTFTFNLINISMPEDPELRSNTYQRVQDIINNALNTLLNKPESQVFEPKSSNFTTTSNHIEGIVEYTFQDGNVIKPVSFLNELGKLMGLNTTTVSPLTKSSFPVTPLNQVSGSALVTSKLLFNSSSPVPSKALVLSVISTLLNSRESHFNESVKLVNVSYEKISETSYLVTFTFNLINISMPEDPELRSNTYQRVQDIINNALNTLLNKPESQVFEPKSSNFTTTSNHIEGIVEYTFQDGNVIKPVSFLNELGKLMGLNTTTVSPLTKSSFPVTPLNQVSGSALVTSKLLFNSSSPVPSKALVLSVISTLLNSRESHFNESVKLVNVSYEKISETSYLVTFTFNLINISMPEDPELRSNTYQRVQDIINNALNTLLNKPESQVFEPKSSNFTSTLNLIEGTMEYSFQDGDHIQPVSFLNELRILRGLTTTKTPVTNTNSPLTLVGKAIIYIRLVFLTLGPVPSESKVLQVANSQLESRLRTKQVVTTKGLSDPVSFVNVTFQRISNNSYALNFGFEINNVTMTEKLELRDETYTLIQNSINKLLNQILSSPSATPFAFKQANFTGNSTVIQADVQYVFSESDIQTPSIFLQELLKVNGVTTPAPAVTSPPTVVGKAIIYIRLVFITLGPIPSESKVLELANSLLDSRLRTKRSVSSQTLSDPVSFVNVTFQRISNTSYALKFGFEISNVTMTEKLELRDDTYTLIQNSINKLLNQILSSPSATPFVFKRANFTGNSTVIQADVQYIFSESDIQTPSIFLQELLKVNGVTTPAPAVTANTTVPNNGTSAAWVVAIIVPCAIAIILVPCWILLCCLLCGCCAAIRRRWHRRRSYNVQYTTRNSLF